MKTLKVIFISMILTASTAFAETKLCANLDKTATAEISEIYIDVLLVRRLMKVEIEGDVIYEGLIGKIDNSEPFYLDNEGPQDPNVGMQVLIDMFGGGMTAQSYTGVYEMVCVDPELLLPQNSATFESIWYSTFGK